MYWDITISVRCKRHDTSIIEDRLRCHHSIWDIKTPKEIQKESKSEQIVKEGSPQINVNGDYQTIDCMASAFHKNDELGLQMYLRTIKDLEITHFIPQPTKEKWNKIFHLTKYSAFIVLIVIFSHESLLIFTRKEQQDLSSWLLAIAFSVIGFLATWAIDSLMTWKEHHN